MKSLHHPAREELSLEAVLHALSDPVRLSVVTGLAASADAEQACGAFAVPVAKSTMSHHMRVLREAGLIRMRQQGTHCFTSLRRDDLDARFPGLLEAVLCAASSDRRS